MGTELVLIIFLEARPLHHLRRFDASASVTVMPLLPLSFEASTLNFSHFLSPHRSHPPTLSHPKRGTPNASATPPSPPLPSPNPPHPLLRSCCCFISHSRHLASVIWVSASLNSSSPLTPARTFARAQKCIFMSICQHSMYFCLFVNTDKKKKGGRGRV